MSEAGDTGAANPAPTLLCADDFAMTNGVSQAIVELAEAGRLSAVSAFTTTAHWPSHATWIARTRGKVAVGLHFNLTLGAPLGPMPRLAPDGAFPAVGMLTARALSRTLDTGEIAGECARQLDAFEAEMGFPPDHVDGHQHVHALPLIRRAVLEVAAHRYGKSPVKPLLRNPANSLRGIVIRRSHGAKAALLSALSAGFASAAHHAGFELNDGFGGVTGFDEATVESDFDTACIAPGPRHLVMCHPGHVDAELERIDPVRGRRAAEFRYLAGGRFPAPLWRPSRTAMGKPVDWRAEWMAAR